MVANGMMRPTQAADALRGLSVKGVNQFRKHCLAGHRPWRSDCAACLDAMAFSKPHKRLARSRICSLSFDVSGPHRATDAEDQDVAKPKYFIVGCYNFPVFDLEGQEAGEEGIIPGEEEGVELLREEPPAEPSEDHPAESRWDMPEEEDPVGEVSEEDRNKAVEDNKRWETIASSCKEITHRIVEIPMVEILPAKSSKVILSALNRFYAKLRSWGLPVYRLHSDCAREYTQDALRQWASHRGIVKTTTMPEHPAGNGRSERLIGWIKSQVRALLHGHAVPIGMWPHAVRYSVEGMQRDALHRLGHDTKKMVPFYFQVRFRARSWRDTTWGPRSVEGHLVAPCTDISRGYIVRVIDSGVPRLYATTLVYQDFQPPVEAPATEAIGEPAQAVFPTRVEAGRPIPSGCEEIPKAPELVCERSESSAVRTISSAAHRHTCRLQAPSCPSHEVWPGCLNNADSLQATMHTDCEIIHLRARLVVEGGYKRHHCERAAEIFHDWKNAGSIADRAGTHTPKLDPKNAAMKSLVKAVFRVAGLQVVESPGVEPPWQVFTCATRAGSFHQAPELGQRFQTCILPLRLPGFGGEVLRPLQQGDLVQGELYVQLMDSQQVPCQGLRLSLHEPLALRSGERFQLQCVPQEGSVVVLSACGVPG